MAKQNQFVYLKSEPLTWRAGKKDTIKQNYLEPANGMSSPVIAERFLKVQAHVTGDGSVDSPGAALAMLFDRLHYYDAGGERQNVSGLNRYLQNRREYGAQLRRIPNIIKSASSLAVTFFLDIPIEYRRFFSKVQTRWNLHEWMKGAVADIVWGPAAVGPATSSGELTIVDAQVEEYCLVVDEGAHTDKVRIYDQDHPITKIDDRFETGGGCTPAIVREMNLFTGPTDYFAGTPWANQQIISKDMNYSSEFADVLLHNALRDSDDYAPTPETTPVDVGDDPLSKGFFVNMVASKLGQNPGELPVTDSVQYRTSLTLAQLPTDPTVIISSIIDRSEESCICDCKGNRASSLAGMKPMYVTPAGMMATVTRDELKRKLPITYVPA